MGYENSWERFNDQFRETEEERNERLRDRRLRRAAEERAKAQQSTGIPADTGEREDG